MIGWTGDKLSKNESKIAKITQGGGGGGIVETSLISWLKRGVSLWEVGFKKIAI